MNTEISRNIPGDLSGQLPSLRTLLKLSIQWISFNISASTKLLEPAQEFISSRQQVLMEGLSFQLQNFVFLLLILLSFKAQNKVYIQVIEPGVRPRYSDMFDSNNAERFRIKWSLLREICRSIATCTPIWFMLWCSQPIKYRSRGFLLQRVLIFLFPILHLLVL